MLLHDSEVICLNNNLLINTKYGKVQGFQENNINKWYGIPFAKPPIHELRFKRSQPLNLGKELKSVQRWVIVHINLLMKKF